MSWDHSSQNPETPANPPPPRSVSVRLPVKQIWVTYSLIAVTVAVFIGQMLTGTANGWDLFSIWGAKVNEEILAGQVWRFLTPMFLHGSPQHILFNMYALYSLGRNLEPAYGHKRFLILYLLAGYAGNVVSFMLTPSPSLGASTAIFGLLGAEGILWYQNRQLFGNASQRVIGNIVLIAGVNLFIGLSPGIDNWGHVGGLLGGLIFAWFAGPRLTVQGCYPSLYLVDVRENRDIIMGAIFVLGLFSTLAVLMFFRPS